MVTATIPMGILQATSTQNDYVVGFALVCFVYFCLETVETLTWHSLLAVGAALGLAVLTKATAYIYAAPFLLWWVFMMVRNNRLKAIRVLLMVVILVIVINLGQIVRNQDLFGNPIGPLDAASVGEVDYANRLFTPPAIISGLLRNISLHLGTRIPIVDRVIDLGLYYIHNFLDIDLSDPRTTYQGLTFTMSSLNYHEDGAGNLLHLLLMGFGFIVIIGSKTFRKMKSLLVYLILVVSGFIIFCVYLRWQPFSSRLHLPWFLLWSPITAIVIVNLVKDRWISILLVGGALLFFCYPWITKNDLKPLFGPNSIFTREHDSLMFNNALYYWDDYTQAVDLVSHHSCAQVGLDLPGEWEYPIWVFLKERSVQPVRLKDVNVKNISQKYALAADFTPCAMISKVGGPDSDVTIDGHTYRKIWTFTYLEVRVLK